MNNNIRKLNWKRSFFTIWSGQAVSLITSSVLQMALVWHLTNTTGSAMVLSIATMVGFLPQAILGTMIGVFVDRWNRKLVMIGADIMIAAAGMILALLSLNMQLPVWAVMAVLFIRSIGTAFHSPALSAATPALVPDENLTKCTGYSQSIQSISFILSPALAALIYAHWGLNAAIALDVLGAIIACITVAVVSFPSQGSQTISDKRHFITDFKEGYHVMQKHKGLFALLWIGTLYAFAYMPINALFPLMAIQYFGGTTTHASIIETAFAVGMMLGGILLGVWGGFQNRAVSIISSIFMMGASITISGLLPQSSFVIFALCSLLMGFSAPFYAGVQTALIQSKISSEYLGRIFGLLGSLNSFAMPLGLILSGVFADKIEIQHWFTITGIFICLVGALAMTMSSIRKIDQ